MRAYDPHFLSAPDDVKQRLLSTLKRSGDCLLSDDLTSHGYARFYYKAKTMNGHRAVKLWETKKPMIGYYACHLCRNKNCVEPRHIYWGTAKDNAVDRIKDKTNRPLSHAGEKHPNAKVTAQAAKAIYLEYAQGGISMGDIAKRHRISTGLVQKIITRKTWLTVTAQFPEIETSIKSRAYKRGSEHAMAKIDQSKVNQIRVLLCSKVSTRKIAETFGVSQALIMAIKKRRLWGDGVTI